MRTAARIGGFAAALIVCLPFHYGWRLAGWHSPWPRIFLGWVGRIAGLRVRTVGRPLRADVLFLANHLSWLDIMLIAGTTGAAFVSKDEVAQWPVVGWLARLNRTVFVARTARRSVHGQADSLRSALATGQPVALFPEGTTEGGTDILPFRASLLAATIPPLPALKIQPVAIDYGHAAEEIAWVGKEPALANVRRVLSRRGRIDVSIHFLEPLDPMGLADRKALAEAARTAVIRSLEASAPATDRL